MSFFILTEANLRHGRPAGTGDLVNANLSAKLAWSVALPNAAAGAVSACFAVLQRTAQDGVYEMRLTQSLTDLAHPRHLYDAKLIEVDKCVAHV